MAVKMTVWTRLAALGCGESQLALNIGWVFGCFFRGFLWICISEGTTGIECWMDPFRGVRNELEYFAVGGAVA